VKQVEVRFETGRDVLNSYWGYLNHGGLVIEHESELDEGENVSLRVHVASSGTQHSLHGRVVKRRSTQVVVAFEPGQPHDMLLSEALHETENVPARRHRRYTIRFDATVRAASPGAAPVAAHVVNLSEEGCCLALSQSLRDAYAVGSRILIGSPYGDLVGDVVWAVGTERGVRFCSESGLDAVVVLHEYLREQTVR
jgi:hypothetical protein